MLDGLRAPARRAGRADDQRCLVGVVASTHGRTADDLNQEQLISHECPERRGWDVGQRAQVTCAGGRGQVVGQSHPPGVGGQGRGLMEEAPQRSSGVETGAPGRG